MWRTGSKHVWRRWSGEVPSATEPHETQYLYLERPEAWIDTHRARAFDHLRWVRELGEMTPMIDPFLDSVGLRVITVGSKSGMSAESAARARQSNTDVDVWKMLSQRELKKCSES